MDGGAGGYPDRREDEQPGIAPVDAGGAAVDQVAPVAEPAVQSTAPVEQPEQPGDTTDAVTGAPANATTASGPTAGESRKYGLFHAMGVPVKPDGRGSPVPRSAVDDHIQQAQEKARRDRADELRHQAIIAAIKRQIRSQDAQELHDAYEAARTFGIDPEALTGQSRILKEMLNDQRFGNQSNWDTAANEIERQLRQIQSGHALGNLKDIHSNNERVTAILEKAERGEKLNQQEEHIVRGKDLWPETIARKTDQNLRALIAAEVRRAQIPESPAMRKLGQAEKVGDILDVLISHPGEILAVKAGQATAKTMATTAGTLLAGPYGGVIAAAFVTFGSGYAAALLEGFKAKGIDLQNKDEVSKAIEKKELMREIFSQAFVRAGIATAADVASGMVGNIRLTNFQSKVWGGLAEKGAHGAAQVGIGVGGKIADGAASRKKPSPGQLVDGGLDGALGLLIPEAKPLAF